MKRSGFTIVELMITLALGALILTLGVPAYQGLVERSQLTSNINQFISSLALARSEAVKRKQRIAICPSINGTTCDTSSNGEYESGWIIYVETVAPSTNRDATNEELLWVGEELSDDMTLRVNTSTLNTIQFTSTGRSNGSGSGSFRRGRPGT